MAEWYAFGDTVLDKESKCLSFPRKRESRKMAQQRIYPDLLRRYAVSKIVGIP